MLHEISVKELETQLAQNENIFLLDVRNLDEYAIFNLGGELIPMAQLGQRYQELPLDKTIVAYCRSGARSHAAVEFLLQHGFQDVKNLIGGILAWQHEIGEQCSYKEMNKVP